MSTRGRFELRVWDVGPEIVDALAGAHHVDEPETRVDCYLVGPNRSVNAKIRDRALEVKRLVATCDGLQRWRPDAPREAPLTRDGVTALLDDLGLSDPAGRGLRRGPRVDIDTLVAIVSSQPDGVAAAVRKWRRRLRVDGVRTECTSVEIGGVVRSCVAIESVQPDEVNRIADRIGLAGTNRAVHDMVAEVLTPTGIGR